MMTSVRLRWQLGVAILAASCAVTGCVQTVHPIHNAETETKDPKLVGVWKYQSSTWEIRPGKDGYDLTIEDEKGNRMQFVAHLARFDGHLWMDVHPVLDARRDQNFHTYHQFPVHSVYLVRELGDELVLGVANLKELGELLRKSPEVVEHVVVEKRPLLTSPTKDLQKFFVEHSELFSGKIEFTRKS